MIWLLCFALAVLASPFKLKLRLEAENAVVCTENLIRIDWLKESPNVSALSLLWYDFSCPFVGSLLKPKLRLEAENAALRHQLTTLRRRVHGRPG